MITLKINDVSVKASEDWTILETSRHYGFEIPTLCFHEAVKATGACRLCIVELRRGEKSKLVASCVHNAVDGLNVYTDSKKVINSRSWILEMLLSEVPKNKEIIELAKRYGVIKTRFSLQNPKDDCIVCELCVRACDEIVGLNVITSINRGTHKKIATPFLKPTGRCVQCGTCLNICPTNAMSEKMDSIRVIQKQT